MTLIRTLAFATVALAAAAIAHPAKPKAAEADCVVTPTGLAIGKDCVRRAQGSDEYVSNPPRECGIFHEVYGHMDPTAYQVCLGSEPDAKVSSAGVATFKLRDMPCAVSTLPGPRSSGPGALFALGECLQGQKATDD